MRSNWSWPSCRTDYSQSEAGWHDTRALSIGLRWSRTRYTDNCLHIVDTVLFQNFMCCSIIIVVSINAFVHIYARLHAFAGDGLFFHSNVLHRSDRNESDSRRWAFLVAYNTKTNNPMFEHHCPRYTPLHKVRRAIFYVCGWNVDAPISWDVMFWHVWAHSLWMRCDFMACMWTL